MKWKYEFENHLDWKWSEDEDEDCVALCRYDVDDMWTHNNKKQIQLT